MFQFVYWLRAIAAVMITNSHYADIWPISAMAFGGHFGNCIYFFLSGFCLYNIQESFPRWYAKRIIRIYPALWIVAAINLLTGFWGADGIMAYVHCLFYPTWYHFITSIMLLYLVFYAVRTIQKRVKIDTLWFLLAAFLVYLAAYIFACDKSYYHIDDVSEKWCRFQFMASMLLGAVLRERYDRINERITSLDITVFIAGLVLYFVGKKTLGKFDDISQFQCILPMIQVLLIYSTGTIFIKLEKGGIFAKAGNAIQGIVTFIAGISLEIYLGQALIITRLNFLTFPLSFVVVTGLILIYAYLIHKLAQLIQKPCSRLLKARQKETAQ